MRNLVVIGIIGLAIIGSISFFGTRKKNSSGEINKVNISPTEKESPPIESKTPVVPLPQETDIIRTFLNLIDEKKPSDAVNMMTVSDDSQKQAWAVQFNAISSMKVLNVESSNQGDWTNTRHTYKVTMDVKMNPDSVNAVIPYYGWNDGENTRWITLEKSVNLWKVMGIATGP